MSVSFTRAPKVKRQEHGSVIKRIEMHFWPNISRDKEHQKNFKRYFYCPCERCRKNIRSRVNYRGGKRTRRREVNKIKSVYNPFLCSAQRDETMKQINVKTKYP